MTENTEQTLPTTPKLIRKPKPQFFTMENWKDEIIARKHIKGSFEDIRARLKDDGIVSQFRKVRHDDGVQSYAIFYGRESVDKKGNKKITYSDGDYLAIHFDPMREFPQTGRKGKKKDK